MFHLAVTLRHAGSLFALMEKNGEQKITTFEQFLKQRLVLSCSMLAAAKAAGSLLN